MTLSAGSTLSHYRILEKIGAGGMGEVYLAKDTKLDRTVAVKILPAELADDEERRNRFEKEAKAASAIDHPNVAHIYEIGESDGVRFIAMQYVEGETLAERMKKSAMTSEEIASIGAQVASALAAAQAKGIVHRDIKPANLVLTNDGQIKVLDFGLAKTLTSSALDEDSDAATRVKTDAGLVMGTVQYMSPEQALGGDVDTRSDIFSLGVVLYEMTARRLPFAGKTATETIEQIRHTQPEAVARFNYDAPPELERCLRKCLEKSADDRYQSAKDLHVDLRNINRDSGSGPVAATPSRRSRSGFVLGAAAVFLASIVGLGSFYLSGSSPQIESLAVLPFENGSGDPDSDFFVDGVTETIISSLSRLPDVKVISRASAFHYKGRAIEPDAVGRELDVEALVLGRIVQRGDELIVSAELVRAEDNEQIWGERYSRTAADVFSIQEDMAREISDALRVQLTDEQQELVVKQHTADPEAYQAYLKGRFYWNQRTENELRQAIVHFQEAIAFDPEYALGYSGLADVYAILGFYYASPPELRPMFQAAAERALELDDTLAEAHNSMGWFRLYHEWDFEAAEREFARAIELNPKYATAHHWYGILRGVTGRSDQAIERLEVALSLDPVSKVINNQYSLWLAIAGRFEDAHQQALKTVQLDPSWPLAHRNAGFVYALEGSLDEAIPAFERARDSGQSATELGLLGFAYAKVGRNDEAEAVLARLEQPPDGRYVNSTAIAQVYAGLGDLDKCFEWLEEAYEVRAGTLLWSPHLLLGRELEDDPRFIDLVRRIGLEN